MIITRTPLRISIGGGGTDLPSYYSRFGGYVISAAIDKYVYIALNRLHRPELMVKYSNQEIVDRPQEIKHPIVRTAYQLHGITSNLEMVSMADIQSGTGLGSSGSFNVGLLRGLYCLKREHVTTNALAEEACHIELDILKEPIGKQDQYIAAFGGLTCFDIEKDGTVRVSPLRISTETLHDLEDNLLMFFTGISRSASAVLIDQKEKSESDNQAMLDNLHFTKELGLMIKKSLESGKCHEFGQMMHQHWLRKKERSSAISNSQINDWYDLAVNNGAVGGKLVGAGGGGFLLFYAEDRERLRKTMTTAGLQEVRFSFDHEGAKVMVNT